MADIEALILINRESLDWELVEKYFRIFEMNDVYEKIKEDLNK